MVWMGLILDWTWPLQVPRSSRTLQFLAKPQRAGLPILQRRAQKTESRGTLHQWGALQVFSHPPFPLITPTHTHTHTLQLKKQEARPSAGVRHSR